MTDKLEIKDVADVVVRFSGDSGDGMQLAGNIFSTVSATVGNGISTFPDYPADIRAPQGSLTGVSGFQVHIGEGSVYTPDSIWLTCVGRLAFPMFAFMLVEGYHHTRSVKKYMLRLLVFAVVSEIPFDLMVGGSVLYPFHQNVMWTLLLGLGTMHLIDRLIGGRQSLLRFLAAFAAVIVSAVLATLFMLDYFGFGVLTVLTFYIFRGGNWISRLGQLVCLALINLELIGGLVMPVSLFGLSFDLPQQGFALLSLVFIWLYNGSQGPHGKAVKYSFYVFYPLHMLILGLIAIA